MASQTPLPSHFLADKSPPVASQLIDFTTTPLTEYEGCLALVLDNVFTLNECNQILALAEEHVGGSWERAMVNTGYTTQQLEPSVRNSDRIIFDTPEMAERIAVRVRPHIPADWLRLENMAMVTGNGPSKRKEVWEFSCLNERLRFLQYSAGEYFNVHCDGIFERPDRSERSYLTLHLYLNERTGENDLQGGSTTFFGMDMKREFKVEPRVGRVLVFQQRNLLHAGEEVTNGTKFTMRTDMMYRKVVQDEASR